MTDGMEAMQQLVTQAMGDFRTGWDGGAGSFAAPYSPTCVFFYGQQSYGFHNDVLRGLRDAWGGRARQVCMVGIDSASALHSAAASGRRDEPVFAAWHNADTTDPVSGSMDLLEEHISIADMQRLVMDMMSAGGAFAKTTQCEVYCVMDSHGMPAADVEAWYRAIDDLKQVLQGIGMNTMLMVLLNDSIGTSNAHDVTARLRSLYEDPDVGSQNRHLYDCVLVYGNRTITGSFTGLFNGFDVQQHTERDILADVIALTNSDDSYRSVTRKSLYDASRPAVTAAFKYLDKPSRDIVQVVLNRTMRMVSEELTDSASVDTETLDRALAIDGHRSAIVDTYLPVIDEIMRQYDGFDRYLPMQTPGIDVRTMPFDQADQQSCGCLSAFVEQNHMRRLTDMLSGGGESADGLTQQIRSRISESLTANQLASVNSQQLENRVGNAFANIIVSQESARRYAVVDAIRQMLIGCVALKVRDATIAVLRSMCGEAKNTMQAFEMAQRSVAYASSVKQDNIHDNLNQFYSTVTESFFMDPTRRLTLLREMLRIGNTQDDMFAVLYRRAWQPLVAADYGGTPVFRLGFMDELVLRGTAGKDPNHAALWVGSELTDSVGDCIGYYTLQPMRQHMMEAYLLHIDTATTSAAGKLYRYLTDYVQLPGVGRAFFDTALQDSATAIWFYPLTVDYL